MTIFREYILFRDVAHCEISSAPGISSIQFRNSGNDRNRTESDGIGRNCTEFLGIPSDSVQFRSIPEFRLALTLMLPCVVKHTSGTS
jgi:hypothetical protein